MTLMHVNDRELLATCALELNTWIDSNILKPVNDSLGVGVISQELSELRKQLTELANELRSRPAGDLVDCHEVRDEVLPILKSALVHKRRLFAYELGEQSKLTFNHELKNAIDDKIKPFSLLMNQEWFKNTKPYRLPKLTDYLALKSAEEFLGQNTNYKLRPRVYDEKFQILNAPSLMLHDLRYYRLACDIRDSSVSIAYIDIDKFKDFNTEYGEPRIDRDLLPKFMGIVEGHVYSCGHAYRYGGDEYIILLPNMNKIDAAQFLTKLQHNLTEANYFDIAKNPTISVGVFEINDECFLTDAEVEDKAAKAKDFAKTKGRNCVALYEDNSDNASTLTIYTKKN